MDLGGEGFLGKLFGLVKPRKEFWSFSRPESESHGVGERGGEPALAQVLLGPMGRADA